MATLAEASIWVDGIRQIENGEAAEGGAAGLANQQATELAKRTVWLRTEVERVAALAPFEFQQFDITDEAGRSSSYVWIPRVRIVAGSLSGWPAADLDVGGFAIDQFPCSHQAAEPYGAGYIASDFEDGGDVTTDDAAVSRRLARPWTSVNSSTAAAALAERTPYSGGAAPTLMTAVKWGEVALFLRWLGAARHGNNAGGRDSADPDLPQSYGVASLISGIVRGGSGPVSWHVTGKRTGLADWYGNVQMMFHQFFTMAGAYIHLAYATLATPGGIDDTVTELAIRDVEFAEFWPSSGKIRIGFEDILYASMSDNLDGTYTLGGLTRGGSPTSHAALAACSGITVHTVVPYVAHWTITNSGLDNTDASSTFTIGSVILVPHGLVPAVGDLVVVGDEQMTVTAISGSSVTVTRGVNSTTKVAAPSGYEGCNIATGAPVSVSTGGGEVLVSGWQVGGPREEGFLTRLLLPSALQTSRPDDAAYWGDWCRFSLNTQATYARGVSSLDGAYFSPRGEALMPVTAEHPQVGFRGVVTQ
jgi:hypothetical protein